MADGVARMRKVFFDRRAVIDRIGRAKAAVLSKAGAFIRRSAKGKIRYAKSVSKPGNPPHAHESKKGGKDSPLRELIFFAYDDRTNSVVIGPTAVSWYSDRAEGLGTRWLGAGA